MSEDAAPSAAEHQTVRKDLQEQDMKHEEEEEEEEEMSRSAHLEPTTLPWPGDKDKKPQTDDDDGIWSDKGVSEAEERDTGISRGSQDLSEEHSHTESHGKNANKWRESMPEGERWRDDDMEVQPHEKASGSMADDEAEEEEEDEDEDGGMKWMEEKPAPVFNPRVTIVRPSSKELHEERQHFIDRDAKKEAEPESAVQFYDEYPEPDDKYYLCEDSCGEKLKVVLGTVAGAVLFPFLVWAGYAFLPFDSPLLNSAPLRVVYTLRCSLFAMVPILLGVLVQGVARLRHSSLKPLYQGQQVHREVAVHWHFVNESLALFLFYFLQLAVMATYVSQDLIKMVPLLTIIFAFGRLIYWLCLSLCSSFRGFGFSFSFFPMLLMLGVNLYYVCSSVGQAAVFDVEPPTTAPPPRQRWFG